MISMIARHISTWLWVMSGLLIAPDLGSQPPTDLLNKIESYQSSTCQLVFNGSYTCSGALINNTLDQGKPLVLTAAHCIESEKDLNSILVIFGKRKLLEGQPYEGLEWSSDAGASLLARSKELDFALLELNSRIPAYVSPVFLAWNNTVSPPEFVSSIHSPDFEQARYSFSQSKPSLATFEGLYNPVALGYWKVDQWVGGTTSLGSSGAPLLNPGYEIIGSLSGSTDWEDHTSDYFFRFDLAYDHFSEEAKQLKAWIDPAGLGRLGHHQPNLKIRNYRFTSDVDETVTLIDGAGIAEEFSVDKGSVINGVYISPAELSIHPGAKVIVAITQNGSDLSFEEIAASELSRYSEQYIPFATPPLVSGRLSVSLQFKSTDSSDYVTIPKTRISGLISYFLAVNSDNY